MNKLFHWFEKFLIWFSYIIGSVFFLYSIAMFLNGFECIKNTLFFGKNIENKLVTLLIAVFALLLTTFDFMRLLMENEKNQFGWYSVTVWMLLFVTFFMAIIVIYVYFSGLGYGKDWGNLSDVLAYMTVGYFYFSIMVRVKEKKNP
ncbi:hypothetical protein [Bacillus sp. S56]|uniref:hypothetical protein n=1 Tax=Bacillus sp. S56 TaxID=1226987 RepID=UPI00190B9809|nr:hypothetical protein [Bacillus sp. S56]MBK0075553.1 hypothetical protein [Bacillus sp. S56]